MEESEINTYAQAKQTFSEPSPYRTICLLNNTGKLFERIFSENQFGFRKPMLLTW